MKGYLSIRETSYKWGVSERRVNQYVTEGRIPGVELTVNGAVYHGKKRGGELQRAQPDRVPAGKLLHPESLGHGAAQRSLAFQRQLQRRGSGRHPGIGDGRRLTAFTAALCVSVH